jgi:hypothetical protein
VVEAKKPALRIDGRLKGTSRASSAEPATLRGKRRQPVLLWGFRHRGGERNESKRAYQRAVEGDRGSRRRLEAILTFGMHPGLQGYKYTHREDGRLKEGGLIMRRTLVLLATMTLVVVASGSLALAASSLNNGNFETGNLSGWSVHTTTGYGGSSSASAVTGYEIFHTCEYDPSCYYRTLPPKEGSYFALLTSWYQQPDDPQSEYTKISQPFEASNGDKISGWAFVEDKQGDAKGQVVITSASGTTVAIPYEESYIHPDNVGWRYWEYTFSGLTGAGQFQIEARVSNICGGCAVMGLDDVKTSTGGPAPPYIQALQEGLNHQDRRPGKLPC